jgi:hypothetical protein
VTPRPKPYKLDPEGFDPTNLKKALDASDPLGQVLRVHLYIEAALVALIETALPYPGDLDGRSGCEGRSPET